MWGVPQRLRHVTIRAEDDHARHLFDDHNHMFPSLKKILV